MTKPNKLLTATALRLDLLAAYSELRAGTLEESEAKELANIAGKAIKTAQVQVAYYALRKDAPTIHFLKDDSES